MFWFVEVSVYRSGTKIFVVCCSRRKLSPGLSKMWSEGYMPGGVFHGIPTGRSSARGRTLPMCATRSGRRLPMRCRPKLWYELLKWDRRCEFLRVYVIIPWVIVQMNIDGNVEKMQVLKCHPRRELFKSVCYYTVGNCSDEHRWKC
jgi:hypothetical protein